MLLHFLAILCTYYVSCPLSISFPFIIPIYIQCIQMNEPYNHLWNEKVKDSVELYIQGRDVPVFAVCDRVRPINRRLAGRSETQQAVVLKQRVCAHSTAPACSWAAK